MPRKTKTHADQHKSLALHTSITTQRQYNFEKLYFIWKMIMKLEEIFLLVWRASQDKSIDV